MKTNLRFQRLGGDCQLVLERADDLRLISELSDAHWAVTSVATDSLICDKEFLTFLDSDANGRIRTDEVRRALLWMLPLFSDLSGVDAGSDMLELESINAQTAEGAEMLKTVRVALANLGLPDAPRISLAQIRDQEAIIADALQNGDGIIPPGPVQNVIAAEAIRLIMEKIGKRTDLGGNEGVGEEELAAFEKQSAAVLAWRAERTDETKKILPFAEKTDTVYQAFLTVGEKLSAYFRTCEALSLTGREDRMELRNRLDPMDDASVAAFLEKAPVAPVNPECVLSLGALRHPEWRKKVLDFFALLGYAPQDRISLSDWKKLCGELAPFGAWLARKPDSPLTGCDPGQLARCSSSDTIACIRDLIVRDKAVGKNLSRCAAVRKLILFQKNMFEFMNNFVTLDRLFDHSSPSLIQAGTLVMDGRCFTLCTFVKDIAAHKKIAENSNICVMYLKATPGGPNAVPANLAVAVTSGHMRHLFLGKSGIFFLPDGKVLDAVIIDFIQQPVSIPEALVMPFYKFADFLQKQADKFFSTRSKQYEDVVSKDIQSRSALGTVPGAAPQPPPQQTPALSGSMVLMGGGVGIAAIGSAFAFMVKSIEGVSIQSVLAIFFGILLIFGGPIILVSLHKLFRRNLSVFLEANGYALNGQMRLSLRMGRFFTFTPPLPAKAFVFVHDFFRIPDSVENATSLKRRRVLLFVLLITVLIECLLLWWLRSGSSAECIMKIMK